MIFVYKDSRVLYNNDVHPVTCEGWHFTDMWETLYV